MLDFVRPVWPILLRVSRRNAGVLLQICYAFRLRSSCIFGTHVSRYLLGYAAFVR